ncbi:MAG: hypothetical protein LM590_08795 [Thermofilum sp.]|nr:hypothetical protein [Thermofilum sp.]
MRYELELTPKSLELFTYTVELVRREPHPSQSSDRAGSEDSSVLCPSCKTPATRIRALNKYYCFTCKKYI